jgi:hypothetical protein
MYNRILKRPMFKMGGRSYSAQGTGITSGLDTPKRGLVDGPGGYAGDEERLKELKTERINVVEPRVSDGMRVFRSFGEYANPYNEAGDALTSGQVGKLQADRVTLERDEQYALEQAAKMENLTIEEQGLIEKIKAEQKLKGDLEITKAGIRPLDVDAKKQLVAEARSKLEQAKIDYAGDPNGIPQHVKDEIEALNVLALGQNYYTVARAAEYAAKVYSTEEVLGSMTADQIKAAIDALIAQLTGNRFKMAKGGRAGYAYGTPPQGATEITETAMMPTGTIEASATEVATGDMNSNMEQGAGLGEGEDAFALLRARLPQEITDNIVQLIAYNPSAFEDFAQIESQEDVIAFNSKYGVELVIDAQQV